MLSQLTLIGTVVLCVCKPYASCDRSFDYIRTQLNFHITSRSSCTAARTATITTVRRHMGLYDEPLPPRPTPRKKPDERRKTEHDMDEDENDVLLASVNDAPPERLFFFQETGKEARNLLPPLSRRLTTGIDCYFEVTDRKVVNLVSKTSCHPVDACWALEACKGDVQEAWIRISTARRLMLQKQQNFDNIATHKDWDEDSYVVEFEQRKLDRQQEAKKRNVQNLFRGGEADEQSGCPRPIRNLSTMSHGLQDELLQ